MKNGYEYYYLFGLNIPLDEFGLGCIRQPKIIDYLNNDVFIDGFHMPFVLNDIMIGKSKDKDAMLSLKDQAGDLTFFLTICKSTGGRYVDDLIDCLKFLYDCDYVYVSQRMDRIVVGNVIITNDNFNKLCSVVLEMLKLDKSKMELDKKNEYDDRIISNSMLEAKRKFLERNKGKKKDKSLSLLDIANIVIHFDGIEYEKVMNMTVFQLKNSFESKYNKESFDINTMYRVSPKFDMSKEKYEHWTEKIKLDKSTLSRND